MRISICGMFGTDFAAIGGTLRTFVQIENEDLLIHYVGEARIVLQAVGLLDDSVVEVSATVTRNAASENQPYAIVVYEAGKETNEQVQAVIEHLQNVGLDVEVSVPIQYYSKKK